MDLNYKFAKPILKADGTPDYAPAILRVVTHHHEEWDEPIIDPETGEPTGETEHMSRDWDTYETKLHPMATDYYQMGYVDVVEKMPSDAPVGYHYEARGWEVHYAYDIADETFVRRVYEIVADPPAPPRRWTRLTIKSALADAHLLPTAQQFLSSYNLKPDYPAWEALTDSDYIEEGYGGDEVWNSLLDGAAQALGKTRAEVDAFLDMIPTEGI